MEQTNLIDWLETHRHGSTYEPTFDYERLNQQARAVWDVVNDGKWRTPDELEALTGYNWASIGARLRDFRKPQFGGLKVERRRRGDEKRGLWEYAVEPRGNNKC